MLRKTFALLFGLAIGPHAQASDVLMPSFDYAPMTPGQLQLNANTQYFFSGANYDSEGGAFEDLDADHSYTEINTLLRASYDLAPLWRIAGGARINYVTTSDETETRTNSELNEISMQLVFAPLYGLSHRLYLEGGGILALNEVVADGDVAITGEAANRYIAGGRYSYLLGQFEIMGSVHYEHFDDGRASRLPYSAGGRIIFDSFSLFGSVFGFTSLGSDEFTDQPANRTAVTDAVNAGSLRYYAVEPELLNSQVSFDWKLSGESILTAGITKTLNGRNSAEGLGVFGGLTLRWGGSDEVPEGTAKSRRLQRRRRGRSQPDNSFRLKEENYDEDLFEEQRAKKRRRPKRRRKIDIDKAIESTIDDLE